MTDIKKITETQIHTQNNQSNSANSSLTSGGNELFQAIQDPVLVVTPDGTIIEANNAALTAAKKDRSQIIGKGICTIIHGGRLPHIKCPLEEFLKTGTPSVEESTLPGLSGEYLLTISPVKDHAGNIHKILLIYIY